MFFSTYILGKKSPLAKIWLAAHWDKKLTRNEVKVIDLNQTVVQIVDPTVPIALRTSGELLIGVVRIYALKVKHLLKEATDATMVLRAANIQIVRQKGAGKDGAIAVTMDLVAGRGADAVCEADFDDIADILKSGATTGKSIADRHADANDVLGTAWFTAEPSQFLEEVAPSQSDDIARIRAEMRSFSTSDSRKSSSSNEKQRLSTGANAAAGDNLFEAGLGGFGDGDYGIADAIISGAAATTTAAVEDAFDLNAEDPFQQNAEEDAKKGIFNKKKNVVVLDTKDTVLSPQELKKMMEDHHDINQDPRRGPFNLQHAMNLTFLRALESQRTIRTASFTTFANPSLQPFFEAAINETLTKAAEELSAEAGRGSVGAQQDAFNVNADPYNLNEDLALNAGEEAGFIMHDDAAATTTSTRLSGTKRNRDKNEQQDRFSDSAIATLEHLRSCFKGKNASTSFSVAAKGKRRIEVARLFVDTLALASHGYVDLQQAQPFAEIGIFKTDLSSQPLPTAAH